MSKENKKKDVVEWYDNPNFVTTFIILMISLIVILSQSFAVNNGLGAGEILSSILNHNIGYLLVCIYFVALKTKVGKRYFDFFNLFLIALYTLTSVTSLLTVLQSFGLGSLLGFFIDIMILIYMIHTFLRSTIIWKNLSMSKSPFNEITNSGYFYSVLVMSVTLLAVNLISTTSLDGTILTLLDTGYIILFVRYIFLYGEFLDGKKISINNEGNFDAYKERIQEEVSEIVDNIEDKVTDIKEDIQDKIEELNVDEKVEIAKKKVTEFAEDVKEKAIDIKDEVVEKVEDLNIDEKIETAKKNVSEVVEDVKEKATDVKKEVVSKVEELELDEKVEIAKKKVSEVVEDVKEKAIDIKEEVEDKVEEIKKEKKGLFGRKKVKEKKVKEKKEKVKKVKK